MTAIAFIGLGNMGGPMAANLVKAGHAVVGYDLSDAALAAARRAGVETVASSEAAAARAEVVITMLPAGRHLVEAYRGGLAAAAPRGALFIDCSTVDVASAREAHELARGCGHATVDAPVSGGVGGAVAANAHLHGGRRPGGAGACRGRFSRPWGAASWPAAARAPARWPRCATT